jgi:hypothetical protein
VVIAPTGGLTAAAGHYGSATGSVVASLPAGKTTAGILDSGRLSFRKRTGSGKVTRVDGGLEKLEGDELKKRINEFSVTSMLSHRDRKPYVTIHFNGEAAQVPPETARELGLNLIAAAEAATGDFILWQFLEEQVGELTEQQIGGMLIKFREMRDKLDGSEK